MMSRNEMPKPPSLTQLFNAPEDYRGIFGMVCGYSADSEFLNNAMERFTGWTHAQRAYEGKPLRLLLMLDPGHPQISFTDVPGLYHVLLSSDKRKPFRLMHAKVAMLGFQHQNDAERWRVRLIVSTGNWTRQTLEESLDLAWCIEVDSDELSEAMGKDSKQNSADLIAAWGFLDDLQKYYLATIPESNGERSMLKSWMGQLGKISELPEPRFIDNRDESFITKIPVMVGSLINGKTPNYIALGSGFYESGVENGEVPSVLKEVVGTLRDKRCLTSTSQVDVFVNPFACQGVANSFDKMRQGGWSIKKANQPSYYGNTVRSLHAKFLFSAYERSDSTGCLNAWIYMGSGNLSGPGFQQKMSAGGNLEAGVLFAPDELYWSESQNVAPEKVVTNLLPIHWGDEIEDQKDLHSGGDMPPRDEMFLSAPVHWLLWSEADDDGGWLNCECDEVDELELLDLDGEQCGYVQGSGFRWKGQRPRQVAVRWECNGIKHITLVAVIDELGRVCATALPELDLDEAWLQLLAFPSPPEDEELEGDSEVRDIDESSGFSTSGRPGGKANHSIRLMMELIENVANKQTVLSQAEWPYWCARLEQTLVQAAGNDVVEQFKLLGLNPLSPLKAAPFRPDFTLTDDKEKTRYETVLNNVADKWGVAELNPIGSEQ